MGYVGYFYVESKSYELRSELGNGNFILTEWGRGQIRSIVLLVEIGMAKKDDGRVGC